VNLGEAWWCILQLADPAFRCLLIHTISATIAMVMAVQRQHSCEVSGLPANCFFSGWKRFWNLARIMIFKVATLLTRLGSLLICTHDLTALTTTKETIHYCESYMFGGKVALNTRFHQFSESHCTYRRWIKYALMGASTFVPTHAPSGPALACPIHHHQWPLVLSYLLNVLQTRHKQPNFHKQ
jgi:hypothetical protein